MYIVIYLVKAQKKWSEKKIVLYNKDINKLDI